MGAVAAFDRETVGLPPKPVPVQGSLLPGVSEPAADLGKDAGAGDGQRGPGRPAGSVNRDTEDMRRYLAALGYRPGQVALAEIGGGASLDELILRAKTISRELGCKPIEAFKIVFDAAREFASYTGSKVTAPAAPPAMPAGVVLLQVTPEQARELSDAGVMFVGAKSPENGEILDVTPRVSDTPASDT